MILYKGMKFQKIGNSTRSVLTVLVSLMFPQEVVYNNAFYAPPVVLVSVHHQYNRQNEKNVPPENNIVTAWVEVRYVFSVYSSCNNNDRGKWIYLHAFAVSLF